MPLLFQKKLMMMIIRIYRYYGMSSARVVLPSRFIRLQCRHFAATAITFLIFFVFLLCISVNLSVFRIRFRLGSKF